MVRMIAFFNDMEILRVKINIENKIDMTLETLTDFFKQFKLDYSIKKLLINLSKLTREPQMIEWILKDQKGVHMIEYGFSNSSSKKKNNTKQ